MPIRQNASIGFRIAALLTVPALMATAASAETVITKDGTAAAVPGGPTRVAPAVLVAAAIDTTGNADVAKQALISANKALGATPGYEPAPNAAYAAIADGTAKAAMKGLDYGYPFTATDFQAMGKATSAPYAITVSVAPGNPGYKATVELYETKTGALRNLGTGTSADTTPDGLDAAILSAVTALGRSATIPSVVLQKNGAYTVNITGGELTGVRGGARVEYLDANGVPFAYGSVIELNASTCTATVAPESAFPMVYANLQSRIVNIPSAKRALPTEAQKLDKDFKKFETAFAISAAGATAVYYLWIKD